MFSFSDINVTVLPTPDLIPLRPLTAICDASNLQDPVSITIYLGDFPVKQCSLSDSECVYILETFFPFLASTVTCTATNSEGVCRFNVANNAVLELIG
jgi:hypothetical protein